jgi:hypothetical protein
MEIKKTKVNRAEEKVIGVKWTTLVSKTKKISCFHSL